MRQPATMATHGGALGVCKEVVSHELLDESCAFLESLRLAATTGKVCVGAFVPHSLKYSVCLTPHTYDGAIRTPRGERPSSHVSAIRSTWLAACAPAVGFASNTYGGGLRCRQACSPTS